MHPKDGVYPEKVNAGRVGVNQNMRRIGQNVNPIKARARGQRERGPVWQEGGAWQVNVDFLSAALSAALGCTLQACPLPQEHEQGVLP